MPDMIQIKDVENELPEKFDFNVPEDIIIKISSDVNVTSWDSMDYDIEVIDIIGSNDVNGAASYESMHGIIDYTIKSMIDFPGVGWFVIIGVTANYIKGDGYSSDDDMYFYYESVRLATKEEIESYSD